MKCTTGLYQSSQLFELSQLEEILLHKKKNEGVTPFLFCEEDDTQDGQRHVNLCLPIGVTMSDNVSD